MLDKSLRMYPNAQNLRHSTALSNNTFFLKNELNDILYNYSVNV